MNSRFLSNAVSGYNFSTMGKLVYLLLVWGSVFVLIDCFDRDNGEPLFLSEFIERGDYGSARNLSLVRHKEMDWLTSYAGYITINRQLNSNMFFWFFPAKYSASTAPLVLWLQGKFKHSFVKSCSDLECLQVFFLY